MEDPRWPLRAVIVAAAMLATPVGAKNAKLGHEVLGEWCWLSEGFYGPANTEPPCKEESTLVIRQDGYSYSTGEEEGADCKAIKIKIVGYEAGATRGMGPDGKPLLPFSAVATPVYRVKYRCELEGYTWNEIQTLVTVKGYLHMRRQGK